MFEKPLLVARREFLENVRTKGFWIGVLFFPIILTAAFVIPVVIERSKSAQEFAVIDMSGWVLDAVRPMLEVDTTRFVLVREAGLEDEAELNRLVANERLRAYFVIGPDPLIDNQGARYATRNITDDDLLRWFGSRVTEAVRQRRMAEEGLDPGLMRWIQQPVEFETRRVTRAGEAAEVTVQDRLRQFAPMAFVYLLFIGVFSISQMLLTNTIEEKSNRLIEVLLSSVSPGQLMGGKIAGIAWTGLAMLGSWIVSFFVVAKYVPGWLGIPLTIDLSIITRDPVYLVSFVVYFVLGYLLFSAMMVAIGAAVSTLKEAQNLMMPVTILLIIPLFAMVPVTRDPNGTLAQVLSFIPPFTPFVMMNRAAGPPALWEYAATTVLLILAVLVAMWAAAKIFRVGILMTGKPPTPGEILRWLRAPVGTVAVRKD